MLNNHYKVLLIISGLLSGFFLGSAYSQSISIKSTDAGMIPPHQQASGCINCGSHPAHTVDPGIGLGVITGGVIGGIVGREIIRQDLPQQSPMNFDGGRGHYMEPSYDDLR